MIRMNEATAAGGRAGDGTVPAGLSPAADPHDGNGDGLIGILETIQEAHGYLPEEELRSLASRTGTSLVDIYGVATFYRAFSLAPRGRHLIAVCMGTACHVNRSAKVLEELERQLGVKAGQTTPDGEFTVETVNCLGACALGPVVVVDGRYFPHVDVAAVKGILGQVRAGMTPADQVAAQ
jgi:NADH:ubiquinone oxidoreductase subunit E